MKKNKVVSRSVPVAELKARLSEYLAAVKRGEEVIVTERGRAVARLTSLTGNPEGQIGELVRAGLLRPPREKLPSDFLDAPLPADPDSNLIRSVLDERAEGW